MHFHSAGSLSPAFKRTIKDFQFLELLQTHIAETLQDQTRVYLAHILFPCSHPKSGFCFLLYFYQKISQRTKGHCPILKAEIYLGQCVLCFYLLLQYSCSYNQEFSSLAMPSLWHLSPVPAFSCIIVPYPAVSLHPFPSNSIVCLSDKLITVAAFKGNFLFLIKSPDSSNLT